MKGFTLIEILIVIGILLIVLFIGLSTLPAFNKKVELDTFTENIISSLSLSRAKTLSSKDEARYGVHFEQNKIVLFKGTDYASGSDYKVIIAPASVEVGSITLNGGTSDVVFKRLTGETDGYGTITTRLKSGTQDTKTIVIEKTGVVGVQ